MGKVKISEFSELQKNEIRYGIESGLTDAEIYSYANPDWTWIRMREVREKLEATGKEPVVPEVSRKKRRNFRWLSGSGMLVCLSVLLMAGIWNRPAPLVLELKTGQAFVSCGDSFCPEQYLSSYSEDGELILPEPFDTEKADTRIAVYEIRRGKESKRVFLRVSIREKE